MVEFMVMAKSADGKLEGLGKHTFTIPPRTGEYVTLNDDKNVGQAYRVEAVIHPLDTASTAGDLILEYVSTDLELRKNL